MFSLLSGLWKYISTTKFLFCFRCRASVSNVFMLTDLGIWLVFFILLLHHHLFYNFARLYFLSSNIANVSKWTIAFANSSRKQTFITKAKLSSEKGDLNFNKVFWQAPLHYFGIEENGHHFILPSYGGLLLTVRKVTRVSQNQRLS